MGKPHTAPLDRMGRKKRNLSMPPKMATNGDYYEIRLHKGQKSTEGQMLNTTI